MQNPQESNIREVVTDSINSERKLVLGTAKINDKEYVAVHDTKRGMVYIKPVKLAPTQRELDSWDRVDPFNYQYALPASAVEFAPDAEVIREVRE